jgi:protein-disulfide isomerase
MVDLRSAEPPPVSEADWVTGPVAAPLVVMYADFTCAHCALAQERLRDLPIRRVFRHFALRSRHPRSVALACAAEAAGRQDGFWPMHDSLFADPGRIDDPHLWSRAERLGLDVDRFEADRRDPATEAKVTADVQAAMRAGVASTPTLLVDGEWHQGPVDPALLGRFASLGRGGPHTAVR